LRVNIDELVKMEQNHFPLGISTPNDSARPAAGVSSSSGYISYNESLNPGFPFLVP